MFRTRSAQPESTAFCRTVIFDRAIPCPVKLPLESPADGYYPRRMPQRRQQVIELVIAHPFRGGPCTSIECSADKT